MEEEDDVASPGADLKHSDVSPQPYTSGVCRLLKPTAITFMNTSQKKKPRGILKQAVKSSPYLSNRFTYN
jgi:hypothetical protein